MNSEDKKALFELNGIYKSFGKVKVLENFNFSIQAGRTTVIIGPSGCGKTVLLKLLIILLRPDKGQVFFDGRRIDRLTEQKLIEVRRRCGFLFQAGALFDSQSVAENVAFMLWEHTRLSERDIHRIVHQKLQLVGMEHMEGRFPSELSGGQQKRVALARAIALSPEVVLYDEPTTGLDPIRADTINELILKLNHELNITSIVVTHDMNSAYKIADHIVMLNEGQIIAEGTADQIRSYPDERVQHFIHGQSDEYNGVKINLKT
ncbi:MAG: ABC transporter ATP-binding protein [Sedimentisphaerales bacterium]|nr:ABC transporter ATP-binding protein [Sedimentisphaerales bacterium]